MRWCFAMEGSLGAMSIESAGEARADSRLGPQQERRLRVSVVIPVKDDSVLLARCLAALELQTLSADEVIVVDNASSDNSAQTARDVGATVVGCSDPGIPAASSTGYDRARGDLILRLDADCIPPKSWIEDMVSAFNENPEISAFTGTARFIDGPTFLRTPLAIMYLAAYSLAAMPALGHRPLFGSNLAMRREAWESVRTLAHRSDKEVHDDLDLSFHLGEHHRVGHLKYSMMGMSMRPFTSGRAFLRRTYRGFRTVLIHWPHDFPPHRWRRLAEASKAGQPMAGGLGR